jgi:hypothetical protein
MPTMSASAVPDSSSRVSAKRRGVSLGFVGLLFMLATPVGLAVAWWHPSFRDGKKRDPLLVLAVAVYAVIVAGTIALSLLEE